MEIERIRNFSIIAHIDHGKTTLSDRLLHRTGTISERDMENQLLDSMDLEKERGITIKAHPVTMYYKAKDGIKYELNLIDTPGHVDFSYEVSRSLSACEGALLIVDAAQGVEAQTVANVNLAMNQNLAIIPVINKIDLPHADVEGVKRQIEEVLAIPADDVVLTSAKEGIGTEDVLEAIVQHVPSPEATVAPSLQALVFDSYFDSYRGVVTLIRVFNGRIKAGMSVKMLHSKKTVEVKEVGSFNPKPYKRDVLEVGETGYLCANIKTPSDVKIGDTLTDPRNPSGTLPGFKEIKPMVFSGIYPINSADYEHLKSNLAKLQLNDSAFFFPGGEFGRAWLRFPLWLPWVAALGDHSGAVAARVQHGHHRHLSQRGLQSRHNQRRGNGHRQPGVPARAKLHYHHFRAHGQGVPHVPQ